MNVAEAREFFRLAVTNGRVAPAYLVYGGTETERQGIAEHLAALLHCEGTKKPCGTCPGCRQVAKGVHPDVVRVVPEKGFLPIDEVRDAKTEAWLTPYSGAWKLFVFEIERMKDETANAMLKLLEEPPASGVLLILSSTVNYFLPTIISRCQRLRLNFEFPAWDERMQTSLERVGKLLGPLTERRAAVFFTDLDAYLKDRKREDVEQWLEDVAWLFRDAFYRKARLPQELLLTKAGDGTIPLDKPPESLLDDLEAVVGMKGRLRENINTKLGLESLFLSMFVD